MIIRFSNKNYSAFTARCNAFLLEALQRELYAQHNEKERYDIIAAITLKATDVENVVNTQLLDWAISEAHYDIDITIELRESFE